MALGRPSAYRPEYAEQAYKLCLLGATDVEIADFFRVDVATYYRWQRRYPALREANVRGKIIADAEMADSLFQRGRGYSHPAVKIFVTPKGGEHIVPYIEHYPPDTTAALKWLHNRQGHRWRDKQEVELTGANGGPIAVRRVESIVIHPGQPSGQNSDASDRESQRLPPATEPGEV